MPTDHRAALANIKTFPQLIAYLRDEMGWPIARDSFEDVDDLFYDFTADELGIDPKTAAKITEIKRLKPLSTRQPWGIFFVKFEPKKLPVVALRRILSQVALKRRASANSADRTAWAADDLLFISNYGEGSERQISFAHFAKPQDGHDLPTLKVLGWDNRDTALHLDAVARELTENLAWPDDDANAEAWRKGWRGAFTLRHGEVVTTSKELSIRLAKLAGDIRDRIKSALAIETERGKFTKLMKAFQTSLVHDLDADGFADMYAQTIAYGLLSARIADPHKKTVDDFAGHMRTNPFLRELMETFLKVGGRRGKAGGPGIDFDELGVSEVVQLLDDDKTNMEAVVLDFGDKNPQEDPVIHFYELFLKEYDAKKRMQRGVFYTPRPVVSYIVRSVDELLRTEFGLEDGLADTTTWGEMAKRHTDLKIPEGTSRDQAFVQILDPATGTGTFLVEVIDIIHRTMTTTWKAQGHGEKKIAALWNEYVPKHLLTRLHAYELLMAPYAIAHLKVGLKLYETGYRFGSDERARIYLTNALEPAHDFSGTFEFAIPALAHEANAVSDIKRDKRFTVVTGNPPYSGISWNMTDTAQQLVDRYRYVNGEPLGERKLWLQNDYIKFLGFAHRLILETGVGSLGYITDNSYLDGPTFRGVRSNLLQDFSTLDVLNLHGSAKKINVSSAAEADQNVFDITQGVAVIHGSRHVGRKQHRFRTADLLGTRQSKYERLVALSLKDVAWSTLTPAPPFFQFVETDSAGEVEYSAFYSMKDAFPLQSVGIQTSRDHLAIDFTRRELIAKVHDFVAPHARDATIRERYFPGKRVGDYPAGDTRGWDLSKARKELARVKDLGREIVGIHYRPFDFRYVFNSTLLVDWPRPEVSEQMRSGKNIGLCLVRRTENTRDYDYFSVSRQTISNHQVSLKDGAYLLPLYVEEDRRGLFAEDKGRRPNLSLSFLKTLAAALELETKGPHGLPAGVTPEDIFHYTYAVFHSPGYRRNYAGFLKIDSPRLPLPGSRELFRALAQFGGALTALHLLESPELAQPITQLIGDRRSEIEKVSWSDNTVWVDKAQTTGFSSVREDIWHFHIGGYQVCEKWLKDRKGRTLSKDDIAHYQKIVVALRETIRLMKEIDVVIEQHGGWPGAFQTGEAQAAAPKVLPFRPRIVQPGPKERYVTCVPLVPLKAAAGAFSDPQHIDDDGFEWAAVETKRRLRPGMFVAQVVGKSMEPGIPDGAYCLFAAPVEGTRQGKTVLVQLRDVTDPESGERYTVKRYESEKAEDGELWRHEKITLKPVNPDFKPIVLTGADEGELQVIAEFVEVLGP